MGMTGKKHTEESKRKISLANKGKRRGKDNPFYGKKHTEESLAKMRVAQKGQHRGEKNQNWKGGRYIAHGYVMVYCPNHPTCQRRKSRSNYVFEHRLVMEKHLGRYLESHEIVHHVDGNKQNNSLENLRLFHTKQHKTREWNHYLEGYKKGFADAYIFFTLVKNHHNDR